MLEVLSEELLKVGLQLNPQKTKILTTTELASPMYLDVHGDMISVLHGKDQHPYLGRLLCGHLRERAAVEYSHRIRVAWHKFHLHRQSLLNKHVSLKNRLKLFQAVVTPAVLYGL
ncbi:XI-F, partial [Symbiodinium necroappetens]